MLAATALTLTLVTEEGSLSVSLRSICPSLSLVSVALVISISSFSFVLSKLDSRSSFSWVLASNSCSLLLKLAARSTFSRSSSSARSFSLVNSSSLASLKNKH